MGIYSVPPQLQGTAEPYQHHGLAGLPQFQGTTGQSHQLHGTAVQTGLQHGPRLGFPGSLLGEYARKHAAGMLCVYRMVRV